MLYCKVKGQQIGFVAAPQKDDIFICQGWTRTLLFNSGGLSTCVSADMYRTRAPGGEQGCSRGQPRGGEGEGREGGDGGEGWRGWSHSKLIHIVKTNSFAAECFLHHLTEGGVRGVGAGRHCH